MKYPPDLSEDWTKIIYGSHGMKFKKCLISSGQIESVLWHMVSLRENGKFELSDKYRDKLLYLGRYWSEPSGKNTGDLNGNFGPRLKFSVTKELIKLEGCINFTDKFGGGRIECFGFILQK